jgi:hypothetical protein
MGRRGRVPVTDGNAAFAAGFISGVFVAWAVAIVVVQLVLL